MYAFSGSRTFKAPGRFAIAALALNVAVVEAQSTETPILEEVIVTATKRGEVNLQDIPVAVTAFSSDELVGRGIDNINQLAAFTVGMELQTESPGKSQVVIRGTTLGRVAFNQPLVRATTGIYLNDVSFEQNGQNPSPDLFDLERVEILRGPQGSLFGSSAMAGAVRYVTKIPEFNEYSGRVTADVSSTKNGGENYAVRGVINIPLVDDVLAARLMAYHVDNDGWIDNTLTGNEDINTDESTGARLSLFWQPSSTFTAHWMTQYQDMEVGHEAYATTGSSLTTGPEADDPEDFETRWYDENSWDDEFLLSSLELGWDFDWGSLTSITGYIDRDSASVRAGAGIGLPEVVFGVQFPSGSFDDPWSSEKISQELRLTTAIGEAFDVSVGAFYSDSEVDFGTYAFAEGWDDFALNTFGAPAFVFGCAPDFPDHYFCGFQNIQEKQWALFGEVDWHLGERWTLTAGGRFFDYDQDFHEEYAGFFNNGPSVKTQTHEEDGFNPKLGLSFQANDDLHLYTTAAKGFRIGGVDGPIPDTPVCNAELAEAGLADYDGTFDSDSLWTYEAGAKSTWLDGRLRVNGSIYYTEWEDIQARARLQECGFRATQNAPEQDVIGFEIETLWAVSNELQIQLNGSYTDAELGADAPAVGGMKADRAPYVSKVLLNGLIDYERPINGNLSGFAQLSFSYRSDSYTTYDRAYEVPDHFVGNFRMGATWDRYTATLYVNNFTDELIISDVFIGFDSPVNWATGRPRTVGIRFMADF